MVSFAHEDADFADPHRVLTFCQAEGHERRVSGMSLAMKERRGGRRKRRLRRKKKKVEEKQEKNE